MGLSFPKHNSLSSVGIRWFRLGIPGDSGYFVWGVPAILGSIFPKAMPRSAHRAFIEREVIWLSEDRRLELPNSFGQSALDLTLEPGKSTHLWAAVGARGQLQILSPKSELSRLREALEAPLDAEQVSWDASGDSHVGTLRRLAAFLRVTCRRRTRGNLRLGCV